MQIQLISSAPQLKIQLGPCQINCTSEEALQLSTQLSQILAKPWEQPTGFWAAQEDLLQELDFILPCLEQLTTENLADLIAQLNQAQQIALVRFSQKNHPVLAQHLFSSQRLIQTSSEQKQPAFADLIYTAPASSLHELTSALQALQPAIPMPELENLEALAASSSAAKPNLSVLATAFYASLNQLPKTKLISLLKTLNTEEMGYLFSSIKMLQATPLHQRLEEILPERYFSAFNSKCPSHLEETHLCELLDKLNSNLN